MIKYFKPFVFILCLLPLGIIILDIYYNNLGAEPVKKIMNHFGEWTLIFICLTLTMSPLKRITNLGFWIKFRRMLGLFVFFYATIHLLTYVGLDYRFDWDPIINDVLKKKYIFIGFSAWLLLIPLAITSSQKMIKILGRNWKNLHRLVYVIAIFGSLHYIWLSKTIFFKPFVFIICLWPLGTIILDIYYNDLGAEPVKKIMNHFGEWTLIFICLTLSMSPLKRITNLSFWIKFRRMLGLFVFFYATIHLLTYVGLDYRFDWEPIINDVLKKKYVFIGFSAWLLLIPLAATSSQKMIRILKHNWKNLHRLVYVIAIFGSLHYIWLSKTIFFKPLIYTLIIVVLLALRIKIKKRDVNYG